MERRIPFSISEGLTGDMISEMKKSPCVLVDLTRQGGRTDHFQQEFGQTNFKNAFDLKIVEGIHKKEIGDMISEVNGHLKKFKRDYPKKQPRVYIFGFHDNIFKLANALKKQNQLHGVILSSGQLERLVMSNGKIVGKKVLARFLKENI